MNPFITEASEQGKVLKECLSYYFLKEDEGLITIKRWFDEGRYKGIVFSGMGSSYIAPMAVSRYLTDNGIPSIVVNASDLCENINLLSDKTLLVIVSQSGKSAEVVELISRARKKTAVAAIVNDMQSPVAHQADVTLHIHAGTEVSISSKSYLNSLAVLLILAYDLTKKCDREFQNKMEEIAEWVDDYINNCGDKRDALVNFVSGAFMVDFIGEGASMSTVLQSALLMREGPGYPAFGTFSAEYAHGYHLIIQPGAVVVVFGAALNGNGANSRMIDFILEHGGRVVHITPISGRQDDSVFTITIPDVSKEFAPLLEIIPFDMMMGWLLEEVSI